MYSHPHMFCEQMTKHSTNLILDDTEFAPTEEDVDEVLELAKQADLVVITNYYARIVKGGNNREIVRKLKEAGHTVVVVTNYPYIEGTTKEADAVVCNFSGSPDSIRISADLLFGKVKTCPTTKLPITLASSNEQPSRHRSRSPRSDSFWHIIKLGQKRNQSITDN